MLGTRRTTRLRRLMRHTGLPPEVLLDLAIEMLDLASRKLSPEPIQRTAVGLGAARWRNVSAEERSRVMRKAAQARWVRHRQSGKRQDRWRDAKNVQASGSSWTAFSSSRATVELMEPTPLLLTEYWRS
jgi:hypothetical protein